MATLKSLKSALEQKADAATQSTKRPLSDTEYKAGFDIFMQGSGWITYRDFIIPQLSKILTPFFEPCTSISILEIGPGPKSILGYLPRGFRQNISRYRAFEPNCLFAESLQNWLYPAAEPTIDTSTAAKPRGPFAASSERSSCPTPDPALPFPSLKQPAEVVRSPFSANGDRKGATRKKRNTFDVVLFCHSMYGINPKRDIIEQALESINPGGIIVIFHQDRPLPLDGLVCHRTAAFPTGAVSVANTPEALDSFAPFVAGFVLQSRLARNLVADEAIRPEWRKVCRAIGRRDDASPNHLTFSSPDVMVVLTRHAKLLPELTVPRSSPPPKIVKNGEAQLHSQAAIVRPTTIYQIQRWVQWALKHRVGMSVLGGGHSGHCLWPNAVAVDMDAFQQIHVLADGGIGSNSDPLVIAGSGCRTGDIIRKAMTANLTVPLGSRPSVGAGLWLQGGIGHLARMHGLACDAIVGAVLVSVDSGRVLYVGRVPINHRPRDAIRPDNEADLLWAIKGAGTNFGIVVSVTFKAYPAPIYSTRNWVVSFQDKSEARRRVADFNHSFASKLPRSCSADAYLYWDADHLHLGITMINASTTGLVSKAPLPTPPAWMGPGSSTEFVNGIGLFETEMYMSGMHGGHGAGKTSSFKRCVFLKGIGSSDIAYSLMTAIETRATPMCYIHLLQGGGATRDVPANLSAFGCRDWDFACVITGVWPRDKDGTEEANAAVKWVYKVARNMLPLSCGTYGADLGPDPRDAALATKAFGPNRPRLSRLKRLLDPHNVLPYAAPLPEPNKQTMVVLISGEHGAGKDHCAGIWVQILLDRGVIAHAVSISEATKRQYAAAMKADLNRLLHDRAYKEEHRRALTAFFKNQMQQRPRLVEEHFINAVYGAVGVDVLFITGIKDEAPAAAWSHLVPGSRLLHVHIEASKETRSARREGHGDPQFESNTATTDYRPSLIFDNDVKGDDAVKGFAERQLLPLVDEDVQRLASMVRQVPDFPRPGFEFRHLLGFAQEPNGLKLCTSLLQSHFTGDWAHVNRIACCEAGGFIFASALAQTVNVPLALIRDAGKLPPPVVSVCKLASHVSSAGNGEKQKIEVEQRLITRDVSVVVVDDVLATGKTLCAVLKLLVKAGACIENIRVMVVAELPLHRGRDLLRQHGFGVVHVESLLVLGGE